MLPDDYRTRSQAFGNLLVWHRVELLAALKLDREFYRKFRRDAVMKEYECQVCGENYSPAILKRDEVGFECECKFCGSLFEPRSAK